MGRTAYFALVGVEFLEVAALIWRMFPTFHGILLNPGSQGDFRVFDETIVFALVLLFQGTYWFRLLRVPVPALSASLPLNHLMMFGGRLNFIFGAAFFSAVFFRHLPALPSDVSIIVMMFRAILFVGGLFTLFCFTLELERLGAAFAAPATTP